MKTTYSYLNASKFDINFIINKKNNIGKETSKQNLPEQKIFRINSLIFNDKKEEQEIYTKYDCIYSQKENSIYLIFNQNVNYSEFTKDKLINILDFANSIGIDFIYKNYPMFNIDGHLYKALKMPINDIKQEIVQINLI